MSSLSVKCHIRAPLDRVFAAASDFPNAANVISGIRRMEVLTEGPVGKGTRFRETRVMFGKEATEEMEVVEFDPPHSYSLLAQSHGCRYESGLRFREAGGGTEVEMVFQGTPLTFGAKVMSFLLMPLMKKSMVKLCGKDLQDLKAHLEGPAPDAP